MLEASWLSLLQQQRVIAVLRYTHLKTGLKMAQAVADAGIELLEVTWSSEQPEALVTQLRTQLPHCTIGAGTILDQKQLESAIAAGAEFLFSPHLNLNLLQSAIAASVPLIPGALTPTEIVTAWQAGASCIKVFPIQAMGGVNYLKNLRSPLPQISLIPTGGVTLENASDFINAGAIAVALSGNLFPASLVATGDWQTITKKAQFLRQQLTHTCSISVKTNKNKYNL